MFEIMLDKKKRKNMPNRESERLLENNGQEEMAEKQLEAIGAFLTQETGKKRNSDAN